MVSKCKITARKPGIATIIAKYKMKKYKCNVVVASPTKPDPDLQPSVVEEKDEVTQPKAERMLTMIIGDKEVKVEWENNESVEALKNLVKEKPLTIQLSMYGGFEQVGPLGTSLPRNDVQTTTSAGDIVLYSGNQIVVFYGSNSWAYTRLGHITDQDAGGMTDLLGNGNVTITISLENMIIKDQQEPRLIIR